MRDYKYIPGNWTTHEVREAVEFDIVRNRQYVTTCVVDIQLLLAGITAFPCGNGDDFKITPGDRLDILRVVQTNREKITTVDGVKTLDSWRRSCLNLDDYLKPGDEVSQDLVDELVNGVPPLLLRSTCTQIGEPFGSACVDGRWGETYTTFHRKTQDTWIYDGACFKGENINREDGLSSIERAIKTWEVV